MRTWPIEVRVACVGAAAAAAAALVACLPMPRAEATGPTKGPSLTTADVTDLVTRCVAYSGKAHGKPKLAIAVVDLEGNALGVYRMKGLGADPDTGIVDAGVVDSAVGAALSKAGTGAYFSSDEQTFTTRTAAFIIQDHFPVGVLFMPAGPLYGVEFSSFDRTDVNAIYYPQMPAGRLFARVETRVRGDLGGVGIYNSAGRRIGGLGIDDGDRAKRVSIPTPVFPGDKPAADYRLTFKNLDHGRALEEVILAAARGRLAPPDLRSDKIIVGGIRLPFSQGTPLGPMKIKPLAETDPQGTWDPDYPVRDPAPIASRFTPFTLDPPSSAGSGQEARHGDRPTAYAIKAGTDGNLSAEDVERVIWQGATQAHMTRGAIRRPIGVAMQCWICVVDTKGEVLGAYRTNSDTTSFSYDVAVQKARTAAFFSDDKAAFSARAVGFFSQGFYPAGQQGAGRGPLFQLQDGLTVSLLGGVFLSSGGGEGEAPSLPAELARIRNGITIFPGGAPLYRDGQLIGGVGVSGDGVDQDDIVADFASRGFGPPLEIRCDNISPERLKSALTRALGRIEAAATARAPAPAPGHENDSVATKVLSFFYARLADAKRTLKQTDLPVTPPYVKYPRHPGPVTIR